MTVKPEYNLALSCLEESAKGGWPEAQVALGREYWADNTPFVSIKKIPKNQRMITSYAWFSVAEKNSSLDASLWKTGIKSKLLIDEDQKNADKLAKEYISLYLFK